MDHRQLFNFEHLCQVNETQDHVTFVMDSISQRDALTIPEDEFSRYLVQEESLHQCRRFKKIEDCHDGTLQDFAAHFQPDIFRNSVRVFTQKPHKLPRKLL